MGSSSRLSITIAGAQTAVTAAIEEVYGVKSVDKLSDKERGVANYIVESDKEIDVRRPLFFALAKIGCPILEMKSMDFTLEEIFLELVASEKAISDDEDGANGVSEANGVFDAGGEAGLANEANLANEDGFDDSIFNGGAESGETADDGSDGAPEQASGREGE